MKAKIQLNKAPAPAPATNAPAPTTMHRAFHITEEQMQDIQLLRLLGLARAALEAWQRYGETMREIGRGADCTQNATGYTNETLMQLLHQRAEEVRSKIKLA